MKSKYVSPYKKWQTNTLAKEEDMILKAKYKSGSSISFRDKAVRVIYPTVRNSELVYLVETSKMAFWLPERLIAQ